MKVYGTVRFMILAQVMEKEYHGRDIKSVTYGTKNVLTKFFFECNMKTVFKFELIQSCTENYECRVIDHGMCGC